MTWVRIPPGAAHFFFEKKRVSRLRWCCCIALLCLMCLLLCLMCLNYLIMYVCILCTCTCTCTSSHALIHGNPPTNTAVLETHPALPLLPPLFPFQPLPVNLRPTYSCTMEGVVICFTGFKDKDHLVRHTHTVHETMA